MKTFTYHYIREDRNLIHTLGALSEALNMNSEEVYKILKHNTDISNTLL